MDILFYGYGDNARAWTGQLAVLLPAARLRIWQPGDDAPADYAIVRNPPAELFKPRKGLKAIFTLSAGVDGLIATLAAASVRIPEDVNLIKLDDAGMAPQMAEYVLHAVIGYARRAGDYAQLQAAKQWRQLEAMNRNDLAVGVMGLGVLGAHVARVLAASGFAVRGWSRTRKQLDGVESYAGEAELGSFAAAANVIVNLLPLTPDTESILNRALFARMPKGGYVINVGRGAHLVEEDLLDAVHSGHLAGAALDVFRQEPLPPDHPFWAEPGITITPHVSALTVKEDSLVQIAEKIRLLETGQPVSGIIDLTRGY